MIPIPPNVYRGQHLRADDINAIHDVLRRLRPIAGDNVRISEGPGGITISALPTAAPPQESARHAWQLIAQRLGSALRLILIPGKVYRVRDLARTEIAVTPADDFPLAEASGVYVGTLTDLSSSGTASLILRQDQETPDTLRLAFASPDSSTLAVIADLSRDTAPHVTQRVTGDIYLSKTSEAPTPAAWTVALRSVQEGTSGTASQKWQIFSPTWVLKSKNGADRTQTLATADWYPLPFTPSATTIVYAVLEYTVSCSTLETTVNGLTVRDSLDDMTETELVLPTDGPGSSANPGTDGHYFYYVKIAQFNSPDTEGGPLTVSQIHLGAIVEDVGMTRGQKGDKGDPGDPGESVTGDPGEDGDTFTPSQRREGADYQDDFYRVYLDFTSEKTGQVTQGTVDIRGPRGPQGIQGPTGTFNPGTAMSVTVVTGVTYDTSTHKLKMTKRTIQFYGTSAGTESTQDIATATPHSGEH